MSCREPHEVVLRLYALISGPRDETRAWDEVASLFHPDAILRSELTLGDGSHQSGSWTVAEFCDAAESEYAKAGFWEREVAARVSVLRISRRSGRRTNRVSGPRSRNR